MPGLRVFKIALLAAGLLLAFAPAAWADTFTVDKIADDDGSGACMAPAADCSLRSAITNANANAGTDTIDFAPAISDGTVANSTIVLDAGTNGPLPPVADDTTISGGNCGTGTAPRPCVGIDGGGAGVDVLHIGAGVTVRGLAITHADVGVLADSASSLVSGNWFGIELDGITPSPLANGVVIISDSADGNTVGGTTAPDRNVFSAATAAAVSIELGADNNTVSGNWFGVKPDGTTPGSIDKGVEVSGNATGPNYATGNVIGGAKAGSPSVCDGACNLIVNATNQGVDLDPGLGAIPAGDPNPSLPADSAAVNRVAGNFIGLGLNGVTGQGNGGQGVNVGASNNSSVGGPPSLGVLRNYIDGNGNGGVELQNGVNDKVQSNYIGATPSGSTPVPNMVNTTPRGLKTFSTSSGAIITTNRFEGNPVDLAGSSAQMRGNTLLGRGSGSAALQIEGSSNSVGINPNQPMAPQGNTIGDVGPGAVPAIDVFGGASSNEIKGNSIGVDPNTGVALPVGGPGIQIAKHGGGASGNIVGAGSTEQTVAENVISNVGGDAISLFDAASNNNRILRNTGRNNGGSGLNNLFVDLLEPDGPGNGNPLGPNSTIEAPVVTSVTNTAISGTSPEASTTRIYVFSTYSSHGDSRQYLGSALVATDHTWTVPYATSQGNGVCVTALQDAVGKGSSEMALPTAIGGGTCDQTPPDTTITSGPADGGTVATDTPTFSFDASDANAPVTFQCSVDNAPFTGCLSPKTTPSLANGSHSFRVRGTDPAGNLDPTPDARSFTVDVPVSPPGGGGTDTTPPHTRIVKVKVSGTTATVTFSGSDIAARLASASASGLSFKCKLDKGRFTPCNSPKRFKHLKRGRHKVSVEAIDATGNVDLTPATKKFRV